MSSQVEDELRARIRALETTVQLFRRSAYPVSTEIDPRGYRWSDAYLDQALRHSTQVEKIYKPGLAVGNGTYSDIVSDGGMDPRDRPKPGRTTGAGDCVMFIHSDPSVEHGGRVAPRPTDGLLDELGLCRRCGGDMKPGIATGQTFHCADEGTCSPAGPGKLISCSKCSVCGWSVG